LAAFVAGLYDIAGPSFAFERDALIGGLPQANPVLRRLAEFFP
jgi:hypothetical protein